MRPLEGIKVVELAVWLAAPTCAALLADCGADVVKVESAGSRGDPVRSFKYSSVIDPLLDSAESGPSLTPQLSPLFEIANRGKRSLALDLSREAGREIFYRLIKEADVVVTNFRPSTLDSLKVDHETLLALNPRLVYAWVTGYGTRGPDRDRPGFDTTGFWSRSGLMALHGEPGGPPAQMHGSIGDFTTSVFLFAGILLALRHRESTGKGSLVDTSLLASGMWVAYQDLIAALFLGIDIPRNSRKNPPNPLLNPYLCSDGRWIHLCLLQSDRYWDNLCTAIERQDLIDDFKFDSHANRCRNSAALVEILDQVVSARTFDEWAERFDKYDIVWSPISSPTEVVRDPQVEANNYIVEIEHPDHGKLQEMAAPFQLNGEPLFSSTRAPDLGGSTDEILSRLGYRREEIVRLKEEKLVL